LKTFIVTFSNSPPEPIEQQALKVHNYLNNIENTILNHPLWKDINEEELDTVIEGLEKYVTTRLYTNLFTIHSNSLEDISLTKRISQLQFINPSHLDIKSQLINDASISLAINGKNQLLLIFSYLFST
jgi:hypothetical protein